MRAIRKAYKEKQLLQRLDVVVVRNGCSGKQVEAPEQVYPFYKELQGKDVEVSILVLLDKYRGIIGDTQIGQGSVDFCTISWRDILKWPLLTGATGVIAIHNHPISGLPCWSEGDIRCITTMEQLLESVGVRLIDAILVTFDGMGSFFGKERYQEDEEGDNNEIK